MSRAEWELPGSHRRTMRPNRTIFMRRSLGSAEHSAAEPEAQDTARSPKDIVGGNLLRMQFVELELDLTYGH